MNTDMKKALVDLIDETIGEIEELKKSDRFSASEVNLGDSKSGIKDMDKNGKLGKDEDKKDEENEENEENEEDKNEDKEVEKAEGKNEESDPNAGAGRVAKGEDDMDKAEGKNEESDPNAGAGRFAKMEGRMEKMESMMEKMESYMKKSTGETSEKEELSKSEEDNKEETLEKSTSNRLDTLEKSLENISSMIQEIADAPVPSKAVSYKDVQPLKKSEDAVEPLTKSVLVDKLFELKKSGEKVDSLDITSAELANPAELVKIANKYSIK